MASRTSKTAKPKSKPTRASAKAPNPPASMRSAGAATTLVPKPPLAGPPPSARPAAPLADAAEAGDPPLKKQELIAKVVEQSDVSKKYAKPVIEAMLEVLGHALAEGREMNLQPMGKIKRKRVKDTDNARITVANIRQPKNPGSSDSPAPKPKAKRPKEAVADSGE